MPTRRQRRVNQLLREAISTIILQELQDPHIGFATVTGVEVSVDLRHAQVYISVMGDEHKKQQAMKAIQGAASRFIRSELVDRLVLKYIPELHFELDETADQAQRIEMLLAQIADERASAAAADSGPEDQHSDDQ